LQLFLRLIDFTDVGFRNHRKSSPLKTTIDDYEPLQNVRQ